MAIPRVFGAEIPEGLRRDVGAVAKLSGKTFQSLITTTEELVFRHPPTTPAVAEERYREAAQKSGVDEDTVVLFIRLYTFFGGLSSRETSREEFVKDTGYVGLSPEFADHLWRSFSANRTEIDEALRPGLRERFGPILSRLMWRLDKPVAGSAPILFDPVGVVTLVLESAEDTFDLRMELDSKTLEYVIQELSLMRQEMAKLNPSQRGNGAE